MPFVAILSAPLRFFALPFEPPRWVAGYIALGVLVTAAGMQTQPLDMLRTDLRRSRESRGRRLLNAIARGPRLAVGVVFLIAIWPYSIAFEISCSPRLDSCTCFGVASSTFWTKVMIPPRDLLARFVAFIVPALLFLALALLNYVV